MEGRHQATPTSTPVIYICGTGMRIPGQMTVETMGALHGCHRIFSMLPPHVKDLLPPPLGRHFENLWPHYRPDEPGDRAYIAIVEYMIDKARASSPVAYLTQGNPMILEPISHMLIEKGREIGAKIEVRPAISRIATLLADLQVDLAPGLQVYEIGAAIDYGIELNVNVPCVLLQRCSLGVLETADQGFGSMFTPNPLRDYLLRFYPADHEVMTILPAATLGGRARIYSKRLIEFGTNGVNEAEPGTMLFVPPLTNCIPDARGLIRSLGLDLNSSGNLDREYHA